LKDVSLNKAQAGKDTISAILDRQINRKKIPESNRQDILDRIMPTETAADLSGSDLVIEAVFENRSLKAEVLVEAESQIGASALLASNTSTLPIRSLASYVSRPENFIGLHFFSPVHKMRLVEIIRGQQTSDDALARAFDFAVSIGKLPIVVNDRRGFYTSRVFSTYLKEGLALLQEGQHPRAIESAGLKAGMPVGPLALSDEVSLSLICHITDQTRKDLTAEGMEYVPHPGDSVLDIMIEQYDRRGKAHGAGFYEYPTSGKKYLWPELSSLFSQDTIIMQQAAMIERLLAIQAIETVRCLQEGVVRSVADANIGSIFGWGFAPFKGGTLQYINDFGLENFVDRAHTLSRLYGARFAPPSMLKEMARAGKQF
jgi:3-hydroxyacyl-CoA dehydrogenase/enoyl-CoA hydratase/3-hydroxybutyryl-CoA epimerase